MEAEGGAIDPRQGITQAKQLLNKQIKVYQTESSTCCSSESSEVFLPAYNLQDRCNGTLPALYIVCENCSGLNCGLAQVLQVMQVAVRDGRVFTGLFSCLDKQGNIVLTQTSYSRPEDRCSVCKSSLSSCCYFADTISVLVTFAHKLTERTFCNVCSLIWIPAQLSLRTKYISAAGPRRSTFWASLSCRPRSGSAPRCRRGGLCLLELHDGNH